jgi:hypothetical protein
MTTEFTAQAITNLLESLGFHVREAREIGKAIDPLLPAGERPIGAIRLEITPKAEVNP